MLSTKSIDLDAQLHFFKKTIFKNLLYIQQLITN